MRKLIQTVVLAALLIGSRSEAAQTIGTSLNQSDTAVRFEVQMPFNELPSTGFVPVRFRIENGTENARSWDLSFESGGRMGGGKTVTWSTSLSVGAGQSREWDLLVPRALLGTPGGNYEYVRGTVRGYGVGGNGTFVLPSRYTGGSMTAFVAMSDSLANAAWSKLEADIKSSTTSASKGGELVTNRFGSMPRGAGRTLSGSAVTLAELPPDWRALAGVAGLWLTQQDWEKLSSERRRAFRTWIEMGGHFFIGSESGSLDKTPLLPDNLAAGKAVPLGLGEVKSFKLVNGEIPVPETSADVLGLDDTLFPAWHRDYESKWKLVDFVGWPQLNIFLVIGFVCLFGLVIGPINLRLFAPPQKRHRLFLTVPLLSIAASVLLGLVILVGDGFGGFGGRNTLVYLPAGENQAFIDQEQIVRTKLLVGRTFALPESVQLAAADTKQSDGATALERFANSASGDWFRSRAVQMHTLRAVVPTRAEVVVQPPAPDGTPTLLSSISATLRDVFYIDPSGNYWRVDTLDTGRPTPLKPASKEQFNEWQARIDDDLSAHMTEAMQRIAERRGFFYATADALPEAPIQTLPSVTWKKQTLICFGPCVKGGTQ